MFDDSQMFNDKVNLEKIDGTIIKNIDASVQKNKIFIKDGSLIIEEGDFLVRTLTNGAIENYEITDRGYYEAFGSFDAHYQCDVRKITSLKAADPYSKTIHNHFNGPNSRYNDNSIDNSVNILLSADISLFDEIRETLKKTNN